MRAGKRIAAERGRDRTRYFILVLVVCLGVALSLFLHMRTKAWERERMRADFDWASRDRVAAFEETLELNLHEIDALYSLFLASYEVERAEFHAFVAHGLSGHSSIQALEWIPRVPDAEREAYEAAARKEGFPDFQITERGIDGVMARAGTRKEYYPVYFVEPYEGNESALGFDLASDPVRLEALRLARDGNEMAATARIRLVQEKEDRFGFLVFRPVYRKDGPVQTVEQRRKNLTGFVLGVFRIGNLLEKSVESFRPEGIDIRIYDDSAPTAERFLYGHASRTRGGDAGTLIPEDRAVQGLHYAETLDVAGRRWRILCTPAESYLRRAGSREPWAVLGGGILFTALLSGYLWLILGRVAETRRYAANMFRAKEDLEREIRERAKAQEALLKVRTRLEFLLLNNPAMIYTCKVGGDWRATFMSANIRSLLGYDAEEFLGRPGFWVEHIHPEDRQRVLAGLPQLLEEGAHRHEYRFLHKDGTYRWMHDALRVIRNEQGEPVECIGYWTDVTEIKRMEEELLKAEKLESVGVLAGGLAHDFNNLLTAILGNVDFAAMLTEPEGEVYESLMQARKASLRARDLTDQLLTFSRGGAPVKQTTSVRGLIREASSFALRGSNVRCEYIIPDDLRAVDIDEGQISQVIHNLIINADQAMPEGGIVTISCANVVIGAGAGPALAPGEYVKMTVADRGTGIPEEHLQKIFDPYFTTKQRGSGLGLATAYSIIKKHGGTITVASELGRGTSFDIYLPASPEQIQPDRMAEAEPIPGRGRILFMDDEEMVRQTAGAILKGLGYEVAFARDGTEAIASYEAAREAQKPFDAVIMDVTIPGGMGGREAVQELLKMDADARAIVSSGYSSDPILSDYRRYGFRGVVAKPYKIAELSRALHDVLTDRSE